MKKFTIRINTIERVKDFCQETSKLMCDVDVMHGHYVIDGKSIMGIFSLDLSKDLEMVIYSEDPAVLAQVEENFARFIIK